jgi:hypothetical protein
MINETRNELLNILSLYLETKKEDGNIDFRIDMLLERFEYQIKDEIKEAERTIAKAKESLEVLEFVKNKIKENK